MRFKRTAERLTAAAIALVIGAAPAAGQSDDAFQRGLDAYLNGEYMKALELWRPAARSGDDVAAFNVGVLYARGLGVEADPKEALKWYRKSALAGYANAQFNLGAAYYNGEGTARNVGQAVSWWEKAARQDHPEALYNLGALYRDGRYVERDIERAVSLFRKAASVGDARAEQALAELTASGAADAAASSREGSAPEGTVEDAPSGQPADKDESTAAAPERTADSQDAGEERVGTPTATEDTTEQSASSNQAAQPDGQHAGGADAAWPANVDPEHWTVQVFAVAKRQAAERYIAEHDLQERVRVFKAEVNGQTWFKGIAGDYPDPADAKDAQKELEAHLGGASLWIRPYSAIQEEAVARQPGTATPEPEEGGPATAEPETAEPETSEPENADAASSQTAGEQGAAGAGEEAGASDSGPAEPAESDPEPVLSESTETASRSEPREEREAEQSAPEVSGDGRAALRAGQRAFNAQNYAEAFAAWQPLAEQGVADAQYGIAFMYESGWGVEKDFSKAFHWYQRAAQQGHVKSQFNLGMLYRDGNGVAQNDALGLYWIQTAADRGDERALSYLKNLN